MLIPAYQPFPAPPHFLTPSPSSLFPFWLPTLWLISFRNMLPLLKPVPFFEFSILNSQFSIAPPFRLQWMLNGWWMGTQWMLIGCSFYRFSTKIILYVFPKNSDLKSFAKIRQKFELSKFWLKKMYFFIKTIAYIRKKQYFCSRITYMSSTGKMKRIGISLILFIW